MRVRGVQLVVVDFALEMGRRKGGWLARREVLMRKKMSEEMVDMMR